MCIRDSTISMDEVIERLIMLEKIEIRKQESENNETIEEDELKAVSYTHLDVYKRQLLNKVGLILL